MNIDTFLDMSENMVVKYFNKYVDNRNEPITRNDLSYDSILDDSEIYEVIIIVKGNKKYKYIIRYNLKTKTIISYLRKETYNILSKKEKNNEIKREDN